VPDLLPATDNALSALFWPMVSGALSWPSGPVLFLGARAGAWPVLADTGAWRCEQDFRPFAAALQRQGITAQARIDDTGFAASLALPPRSREGGRALLARAVRATGEGGLIVAAAGNEEGGRSLHGDLGRLLGNAQVLSKFKCRIVHARRDTAALDADLLQQWLALDSPRQVTDRGRTFWTRPGLFAWDRIDAGSALLAEHLPTTLSGHVADLGAGWGFQSMQVARHCPQVVSLDLFEAQAGALEPAQRNLAEAAAARPELEWALHWHDVGAGLPGKFDVIISNPPFHVGRADLPELGRAFIVRAAQALTADGALWLVANRHLPYEATLAAHFAEVRTLAERDGFKVIHARIPKS